MTPDEIKAAMSQPLELATKTINESVDGKVKTAVESAEKKAADEAAAIRLELKDAKEAFENYKKEMGKKKAGSEQPTSFAKMFGEFLQENEGKLKNVAMGERFAGKMDMKAAPAVMTTAANLTTGVVVTSYQPGMAMLPFPKVNFTDMVQTVPSATGSYTIYAQNGEGDGSIAQTSNPGVDKGLIDFNVNGTVFTAKYIAGYVRIAKEMMQDLPFLQSYLPTMLLRKFLKAESTILQTQLIAQATAYTTATGIPYIGQIINAVADLENNDYTATAIVVSPTDWGKMLQYKASGSGQFTYPGSLMVSPTGVLILNGIPVYKASFMTAGQYWVGDWDFAKKIVTDGLKVEFFEQDSDNVEKNLITVRIEQREVLGIDLGGAFRYGTFVGTN